MLKKGWIRVNKEKLDSYTIVSSDKLINSERTKCVGIMLKPEVFEYSLVKFRAYISEACYQHTFNIQQNKKNYNGANFLFKDYRRQKGDIGKAPKEKDYSKSIRFYRVNPKTLTTFKNSKLDGSNFRFRVIKLLDGTEKRYYNVFYNIKTKESNLFKFFKDKEEIKGITDNVKLYINELIGAGSCKPNSVAESACSYSYRAYIIKKSRTTVRKYQEQFSSFYVKSERILVDKDLEIEHGKFIKDIFGSVAFNQTPTKRKYRPLELCKFKINR